MEALSLDYLPLGFRFRPTDEELINHYLRFKINGRHSEVRVIPEVDVCKCEPWDLPQLSVIKTDDPEWFFFCPKERKYQNGLRSNRATDAGYWKATGKDRTIKSRNYKSATNTMGSIGMKKTLVFHRGRAPKGERTNWIMHEYRPTLKDLDGTGPGQGAYVLFRLFHKPEEKPNAVKYDVVEHSGLSLTTSKSSPDDTSSDLLQAKSTSNLQGGEQSDGIKRWLTDKADNLIPGAPVAGESCFNSSMASELDDRVTEETPVKANILLEETSKFYKPSSGQIDLDFVSRSYSQLDMDVVPYVGSPFASDFGNDNNGLKFLDGTCEQYIYISNLWDFNNHEDSSCEESILQKNSANGFDTYLSDQIGTLQSIQPENSYISGVCHDSYTEMGQMRGLLESSVAEVPHYEQEHKYGDRRGFEDDFAGHNTIQYSTVGSANPMTYEFERAAGRNYPIKTSVNQFGGTGIKMTTGQLQQQQISDNFINQGTARRSNCLQTKTSSEFCTEAKDIAEQSSVFGEPETEYVVLESKTKVANRTTALDCNSGFGIKIRAHPPLYRKVEIPTQGDAPRRICLQMDNSSESIANDNAEDLKPSTEDCLQRADIEAYDEKEDEVDSAAIEASELAEQDLMFDKQNEENRLLDLDTWNKTVEESSIGKADVNGQVSVVASAESLDPSKDSFEESSSKLRLRGKHCSVSVSCQKQALLFMKSTLLHRGWRSRIFATTMSVVLILLMVSLSLPSSDLSAARGIL